MSPSTKIWLVLWSVVIAKSLAIPPAPPVKSIVACWFACVIDICSGFVVSFIIKAGFVALVKVKEPVIPESPFLWPVD